MLALFLALLTFAVYVPTARNGFVNLDDNLYISDNPQVKRGLTLETVLWALRSVEHANWYPLRRLTNLADVNFFGMWAGGHHLVSAAWHAAAAALLFLALCSMTGALWRSLMVAALFSLHPLQVESVAWAAERSNVLAGFFLALTLLFWERYARRPGAARYGMVLVVFALGLMAKPVLMTLPFVLLLLDVWPLGRLWSRGLSPAKFAAAPLGRLLLEKVPLIGLSMACGQVAIIAHRQIAGALTTSETLPLVMRLANAALSYWRYLGKLFWPVDLLVLYPHPGKQISLGSSLVAGLLLAALTVLAFLYARRQPWLGMGWLWYVGMLVPVSGIVQFGSQAMADRFMYLPSIGIFTALVWFITAILPSRNHVRVLVGLLAGGVLVALTVVTMKQELIWRDSETLFRHTLAHTSKNFLIHNNFGNMLLAAGRFQEAITEYQQALPFYPDAHTNLGVALSKIGRIDEAIRHFEEALRRKPGDRESTFNLNLARTLAAKRNNTSSTSNP